MFVDPSFAPNSVDSCLSASIPRVLSLIQRWPVSVLSFGHHFGSPLYVQTFYAYIFGLRLELPEPVGSYPPWRKPADILVKELLNDGARGGRMGEETANSTFRGEKMADPRITLAELNKNLSILQEREAKYGGNTPLELLNQIDDHQQAIDLTRQAITGELSQVEWQEALKPLLLACRNGQVVNIQAETYVAGDQIITQIYEAPPPPLPPAEAKERHDLTILLNKVKTFWIEGVLEKSVHNIALIDLGKETQAEAVAHAWEQVLELPDRSRQTLPPDKKISQIFDEMNRALLILGSPGSGKTITLLQLARDLIAQAEQDETLAQPVPVVFNLSTWSRGHPLLDWLAAELSAKYQIPKRIGRPWLENHRLLPLLDGLDEVQEEERAACVEAINQFGAEYGLSGLVVCSRVEEYTCLPVRLKLNGAIRLQPLTLEQVYDYLDAAGSKLEALRVALEADDSLKTLAQTPLTLGIMTLAYQNISPEDLAGQANTLEARRKHLLDTYIERMFQRKGLGRKRYSDDQTKAWLSWLANGMMRYNQGIFLIEQLQPSWLMSRKWSWLYLFGSRLTTTVFAWLIGALTVIIYWGDYFGLNETLAAGPGGWLIGGVLAGLIFGSIWAIIDGLRFERRAGNLDNRPSPTPWQQVIYVLVIGLIFGLTSGLICGLFAGQLFGVVVALGIGPFSGLYYGIRGRRQSLDNDIQTVEALHWSWQKALKSIPMGFMGGLIIGLAAGLAGQHDQALVRRTLDNWPFFGLFVERNFVLAAGLFWALIFGVGSAMFGGLRSTIVETKTTANEGIRLSLRNAVLTGLGFGLIIGLITEIIAAGGSGVGPLVGLAAAVWYGGLDIIKHYTLRVILWYRGRTPFIFFRFLNYATNLIFLQRVGGGYIFIHRLLLEHFAAMDETLEKSEGLIDAKAIEVN